MAMGSIVYSMKRGYPVLVFVILAFAFFGAGVTWSEGHYVAMSAFVIVGIILFACLLYHMGMCKVTVLGGDDGVYPDEGMKRTDY